ncbi:MAG: lipoprotein-releasing ABC transporter permease subunit [Betaproteobacteria bacterium]|nr:lipoprotein-releasing ABC transporter permease subunit [Betaproteobacteria bacterium]
MRYFEFFVGLRFTLTGKHDRFVSFVSMLSMLGIALGVAALLTVLAVMTGFQTQLRARILNVASHMEAVGAAGGIADWQKTAAVYTKHPQVLAAAPNIQEQGLLAKGGRARGALVHGILPAYEPGVNEVGTYLQSGALNDLTPGGYKIFLGDVLAQKLGATLGDKIALLAPQGRLTAAGFLPRLRRFEVAGIFHAGVHQFDSSLAYIHLQDAQRLYRRGDSVSSVRLKLDDVINAPRLRLELQDAASDVVLYDWTNSHGELFRALALEKRAMFVILTLIVMVASFNIVSALVTMVRNKRPEIAILRAMGADGGGIMQIFLLQGMLIGGGGVVLGLLAGLPLAKNAGAIVAWVEEQFGHSLFPGNIYQLGRLPSEIILSDVLVVSATAFCIALAAAVYPAWRGGRLSPAEALRHE